jgi:hypothetical protein
MDVIQAIVEAVIAQPGGGDRGELEFRRDLLGRQGLDPAGSAGGR